MSYADSVLERVELVAGDLAGPAAAVSVDKSCDGLTTITIWDAKGFVVMTTSPHRHKLEALKEALASARSAIANRTPEPS